MEDQIISIFPEKKIVYGNFGQRFAAALIDGILLMIVGFFVAGTLAGKILLKK